MKSSALNVSIITATYESLATLTRTVESVREQVGVTLEHIVVDGGSRDGTAEWLQSNLPGGSWISERDEGIGDAMNKGVSMAKGDWLLFLQADDRLASERSLTEALGAWDEESDLIASPIQFESGRVLAPRCDSPYYRWFKQGILHQGMLVRRTAFARIGFYNTSFKVAMDYDWFLRAHWARLRVQMIEKPLSVMGEEGVGSQRDWSSLSKRLREEQRSRLLNSPNSFWTSTYRVYWPLYLGFRYLGSLLRKR